MFSDRYVKLTLKILLICILVFAVLQILRLLLEYRIIVGFISDVIVAVAFPGSLLTLLVFYLTLIALGSILIFKYIKRILSK